MFKKISQTASFSWVLELRASTPCNCHASTGNFWRPAGSDLLSSLCMSLLFDVCSVFSHVNFSFNEFGSFGIIIMNNVKVWYNHVANSQPISTLVWMAANQISQRTEISGVAAKAGKILRRKELAAGGAALPTPATSACLWIKIIRNEAKDSIGMWVTWGFVAFYRPHHHLSSVAVHSDSFCNAPGTKDFNDSKDNNFGAWSLTTRDISYPKPEADMICGMLLNSFPHQLFGLVSLL